MKPKILNNTEYSGSWIRVTLYSFQHYWINTQTGRLYNERSGKSPQGSFTKDGYRHYSLRNGEQKRTLRAHQLVYYSFHNYTEVPKGLEIDHVDHNKLNNYINNLRLVTKRQNLCNRDSILPPGVSWDRTHELYVCHIYYTGKSYYLGSYPLPCLAAKAYEKAEQQINEGTFTPPKILRKGTSKYPGVSLCKRTGKWRAKYKDKHLGYFSTPETAYKAYCNGGV